MKGKLKQFGLIFCLSLMMVGSTLPTTLSEVVTIFSLYIKNPAQVGEIAPISQAAGKELARHVGKKENCYYLEAGGGCGAVSVCIAEKLNASDHLDVIEINPAMCKKLQERLAKYPNVTVHCCSILDWSPQYKYDGIISTLPFNSLGSDFTKQTIEHFEQLSAKEGIVSYVEYPIVGQVIQYFYTSRARDEFQKVQSYMAGIRATHLKYMAHIMLNVPPINIYHLMFHS